MNAIEVKHVYKKIGEFELRDLSFSLEQGTVMGFIGQNGAGKSTTIKCILNLLKITTGEISVFGKNHIQHEVEMKEDIGVVFDELHIPDSLTSIDLNKFYGNVYKNWDSTYFFNLLEKLDVSKYTKVKDLSRGMKMKLSLALALSHHPKLLILDEPTSGLDPIVRDEVLDMLLVFMEDESHSILFSSHITSDLEKIADTITFIHKGEIVFSESKDVLLYDYGLWKGTVAQATEISEHAILGKRKSAFGIELLVKRTLVSPAFTLEKPTIDDVMVFFVKGA
ncbi:ABC transporter ATP-binding protein [Lysinibacillus sp. KU-BSD001]|uniref:ABC transporter ATP-binding protein n=1 Tax=Lysinibacillus sp. KU-BSD001 TaxID=3141328 RepID=UPI0036E17D51